MSTHPVSDPIVVQIGSRTWLINEFGMDAMFLLEGDEKALLIDTGTGTFDIPRLISGLTDKPVIVALTHGHMDHAGGISMFPEVMVHPEDYPMLDALTNDTRRDYIRTMMSMCGDFYTLTDKDIVNGAYEPRRIPIRDGDIISLGNRDIRVYETPGHTPGSVSFLDRKERIFFTGDACNPFMLLATGAGSERGTVSTLMHTSELIDSLRPLYDRNYNGHVGYAASVTRMMPMKQNIGEECAKLCKKILDRTAECEKTYSAFAEDCIRSWNSELEIVYTKEQVR